MLETICDIIVLVTAAAIGILKFFEACGKPISFVKNKRKKEIQEVVNENLDKKISTYFEEKKIQTRENFAKDRENCLEEIKKEVIKEINEPINEIKETLTQMSKTIEVLKEIVEKLPDDFVCPICGVGKECFELIEE